MLTRTVIAIIRLYQHFVSPLTGPACRFYPSCSHYSIQSLETHGLVRGLWRTVVRLLKCHPFHPGGYDPVN